MQGRNMTRWRDPAKDPRQEPKSPLITAEGQARLQGILEHLSRVKRPALSAKVGEAAALGDRSENADYTYNKKELNRVIARIRYLTKRLEEVQVVDRLPADRGKVYFGAFVTLALITPEDEAGEELEIRIVGHDETDTQKRWISVDAPLARALLGKSLDDEATVAAPGGSTTYLITEIHYRDPQA
ncbi:transcription elongation factor GreB [Pistricoccus aurantiacus]|uniref:Transcription elongation factor GreB n=1 Tax=Pistricoccus aurantiacus TaxID=1883414 RepID=A0A5B8SQ37_9GAMM|nr:transcription elongation factor GreB [Pistricoccus aurantiacus]QEA39232.1 transcription elongation factor GreB [Pistricoccus aurantiacus]